MKWIFVFLLTSLTACGQKTSTGTGEEIFNSKYVKLLPDTNRMMMIENVVIKFGDLYAEADSALLEKPKQIVMIYGLRKVHFKNETVAIKDRKTLHYKKGDEAIVVE